MPIGLPLRSIRPSDRAIQPAMARTQIAEQDQAVAARTRRRQPFAGSEAPDPCQISAISPQKFMNVAHV